MPNPSVSPAQGQRPAAWFGKIPSQGDFVGRRMPHALSSQWDNWLRSGLEPLHQGGQAAWQTRFAQAPTWFFMSTCQQLGLPLMGALAPSTDRVGRSYPLAIMAIAEDARSPYMNDPTLSHFFTGLRDTLSAARRCPLSPEQIDEQLTLLPWPFQPAPAKGKGDAAAAQQSVVNDLLASLHNTSELVYSGALAELPQLENWRAMLQTKGSDTSVWWVSPSPQFGRDTLVHHGPLHSSLFARLFKLGGAL